MTRNTTSTEEIGTGTADGDSSSSNEKFYDSNDSMERNNQDEDSKNLNNTGATAKSNCTEEMPNSKHAQAQHWRTDMALPGEDGFDEHNAHVNLVLNEWAGGTSVHGVPFVSDFITWRLWKRIMWLVLVCSSGAIMVWQIENLIEEYRKYDVITDTETIVPTSLEFPEVTVCNYNSFSQKRKEATGIDRPRNDEELLSISQPLEEFILDTYFNGEELNISLAWRPKTTLAGLCFSFQTNETILRPGLFGGLQMDLYLNQLDFETNETEYAGVMIWIQKPGTPINDQLPFIVAIPGQRSVVNVEMSHFIRERQAPWARCHGEAPSFTQDRCRVECLDHSLRSTCGCKNWGDKNDINMDYCYSDKELNCTEEFEHTVASVLGNCSHCDLPPCDETNYEASVSVFSFSNLLIETFVNYFARQIGLNSTTQRDPEVQALLTSLIADNLVSVQINFDKIQFLLLTESKAVSLAQLLGSIGGSMGLFLGISMLSIFEVVGDLGFLRLLPRMFGYRHLNGLGAR